MLINGLNIFLSQSKHRLHILKSRLENVYSWCPGALFLSVSIARPQWQKTQLTFSPWVIKSPSYSVLYDLSFFKKNGQIKSIKYWETMSCWNLELLTLKKNHIVYLIKKDYYGRGISQYSVNIISMKDQQDITRCQTKAQIWLPFKNLCDFPPIFFLIFYNCPFNHSLNTFYKCSLLFICVDVPFFLIINLGLNHNWKPLKSNTILNNILSDYKI